MSAVEGARQKSSVQVEWEQSSKYDESNPLILPSSAKLSKAERKAAAVKKKTKKPILLSKKQRKKLEKIVERRSKKKNRAEILDELQKYQLPPEIFNALTPLVKIQTEGIRRLQQNEDDAARANSINGKMSKGSIKGANKNKAAYLYQKKGLGSKNPKVLGLEGSSSDSDGSSLSESDDIDEDTEMKLVDDISEDVKSEPVEVQEIDPNVPDSKTLATTSTNGNGVQKLTPKPKLVDVTTGPEKKLPSTPLPMVKIPSMYVHVKRNEDIELARSKLPIIAEEQVIMEAIMENTTVVLAGETGCGKTTQVPQFLYEAGYALKNKIIGITEPRRVAAMAMSFRVGKELNLSTDVVSYQIRFEGNATDRTKIKFMTDGVLLKEMEKDFLLTKYSVICIDEAHERSLYTDILIGLLSRCVLIRKKRNDPLKVIIMSATLRAEDFTKNSKLYKNPPAFIHVPARQFPVQIHFSKVTKENYIEVAMKKIISIHAKLPPGGILIFVTGQLEVKTMSKKLKEMFSKANTSERKTCPGKRSNSKKQLAQPQAQEVVEFDLDDIGSFPNESDEEGQSDEDDESVPDVVISDLEPLHVVSLYSMLPTKQQQKVFQPPPKGSRLCVVATNIAETSLTIPSVRYVVDCGKVKEKQWDKLTGIQTFKVSWCSKASAQQRSGRAGRTGPGHCYRLYSSAVFNTEFSEFSKPEIQVRPVDDMVLLMKSMSITRVRNFPYPSSPVDSQLVTAENLLILLGALEVPSKLKYHPNKVDVSTITALGKTMAQLPVSPRFSKMLAISFSHSVVGFIITLVSAFTVQEVLLDASTETDSHLRWSQLRKKWAGSGSSLLLGDCMVLLKAVSEFESGGGTGECSHKLGLRHKAMLEIQKLRKQLASEIFALTNNEEAIPVDSNSKLPTDNECAILRQIILSGCPDKIAKKLDQEEMLQAQIKKNVPAYWCGEVEEPTYLHTTGVLKRQKPEWIVYQEAYDVNGKVYLRGITSVDPAWIPNVCPNNCNQGEPLKEPAPYFDQESGQIKCHVESTYGRQAWKLPITTIDYPSCLEKYKLFAEFLLSGDIFPEFQTWTSNLLSLPSTMTKGWARLQPRTQTLLQALLASKIESRTDLSNKWSQDKQFLLKEYLEWIPETLRTKVSEAWPPV